VTAADSRDSTTRLRQLPDRINCWIADGVLPWTTVYRHAYSGDACRRFRRFWGTGLPTLLQYIDAIDAAIGQTGQEVDARVEPVRTAIEILSSIPGISDLSAEDQGQLSSAQFRRPQLASRFGQPRLTGFR